MHCISNMKAHLNFITIVQECTTKLGMRIYMQFGDGYQNVQSSMNKILSSVCQHAISGVEG